MRGDLRVDQQRDLRHRHPQDGRRHLTQDGAPRQDAATRAAHAPGLKPMWGAMPILSKAGTCTPSCNTPPTITPTARRIHRLDAMALEQRRHEQGRADGAQVEQHRGGGRHRKAAPGVEDARAQGHQGHEADVGEHPARHDDGGIKTAALFQTRGHDPDQHGRADHAQHTGDRQGHEQDGAHGIDQIAGGLVASPGTAFGQDGHKGLREGALGKQAAQQIGNAERHVEGVGGGAGPEGRGDQQLPNETGDA